MNYKKIGLALILAGTVLMAGCGKKAASDVKNEPEASASVDSTSKTSTGTSLSVSLDLPEEPEVPEGLPTLMLGSYEQDGNPDNGAEPIEWIVLFNDGTKSLVVSRYVLDCVPFNKGFGESDWENSSVRKFLNNDFYNNAFTPEEQGKILESDVPRTEPEAYREARIAEIKAERAATEDPSDDTLPIPEIEIPGTKDRVFLLSDFEVKKYLPDDPDLWGDEPYAKATSYAASKGVWFLTEENYKLLKYQDKYPETCIGSAWWWLRTNSEVLTKAKDVNTTGDIRENGHDTGESHDGVRPAMWVNIVPD
ncbi:MAG: DUF6273 domain-containing protein [Lachnospiraceae bacterium]|nr:DUF6273 domain-containing protein [Lachnospiraceae bacterium]